MTPIQCEISGWLAQDLHNICTQIRRLVRIGIQIFGYGARRGAVLFMVLMCGIVPAKADISSVELGNNIRLEALTAMPGPVGGVSQNKFRIVNESTANLVLMGISTPVADRANLVADLGAQKEAVRESSRIPPSENLDLTTSHLRYEIFPLKRSLEIGDRFPVKFSFVAGEITVLVHVHFVGTGLPAS